jgi:two-component system, NarL family, response regulator DegU
MLSVGKKKNKVETKSHCTTILVVDNNSLFRKTLLNFLETQFKSVKLIEADSGSDAIQLVQENVPDLIVLDINMPNMSGFEVAQQVKQEFPFIPIIILTNYDENEYRLAAKKTLVDAFIIKKNLVSELPSVVKELIASPF